MDKSAIQKYLAEDYARALLFYDNRACIAKLFYRILSVCVIVISAVLTPVVALAPDETGWRIFSAVLSSTIVVLTGLLAHFKWHENWLSYRSSWDALERERRQFETSTAAYKDTENKEGLFVERIEAILAREGADFYARHSKGEDQKSRPENPS